jgi:hypothetical protein
LSMKYVQPPPLSCERMLANTHSYAQSPYKTTIYCTPAGQKIYIFLTFLTVWNDYLRDSTLFSKCLFMMTTCPH